MQTIKQLLPQRGRNTAPAEGRPFVLSCFEWAEALVVAVIIGLLLFTFVFRINTVDGESMEPNLMDADKLLVSCIDRSYRRGDVVVVDNHRNDPDVYPVLVKRVIATEGETVDIDPATCNILVNGEPLDESSYLESGITQAGSTVLPATVPPGCVFVMGDNRMISLDSRDSEVGFVDCRMIIGKAAFRLIPFGGIQK